MNSTIKKTLVATVAVSSLFAISACGENSKSENTTSSPSPVKSSENPSRAKSLPAPDGFTPLEGSKFTPEEQGTMFALYEKNLKTFDPETGAAPGSYEKFISDLKDYGFTQDDFTTLLAGKAAFNK